MPTFVYVLIAIVVVWAIISLIRGGIWRNIIIGILDAFLESKSSNSTSSSEDSSRYKSGGGNSGGGGASSDF